MIPLVLTGTFVMGKTHEERVFGAACVYVALERSGVSPEFNEIYRATLTDLGLRAEDVEVYLKAERTTVEAALDKRRDPGDATR